MTEYSWDATTCDPCPEPPLRPDELATLGADVLVPTEQDPYSDIPGVVPRRRPPPRWRPSGFVLTRLHYRYEKDDLGEDLVFRAAGPIVGGRGMPDQNGDLQERRAQASSFNNFQGRYVILHRWEGPIECENPVRGTWGGPPNGPTPRPFAAGNTALKGASGATLTNQLPGLIRTDIPELDLEAGKLEAAPKGKPDSKSEGKGPTPEGCSISPAKTATAGWIAFAIVAMWATRRRVAR